MRGSDRERFDRILDEVLELLPAGVLDLFEEKPLVVEDHPTLSMLRELGMSPGQRDEICGLHTGPMGHQRVLDASGGGDPVEEIGVIHVFREGIIACAGGWTPWEDEDEDGRRIQGGGEDLVREEIRITVLHEVGHHFGLDEDDLEALGYD